MYVELFVVAGQHADLEQALKKAVEDIRSKVQRPDKVRLATIKIRPDAVEHVVKLIGESPDRVPPHYRSLVNMLKKYGISTFPAVVIDGAKAAEGEVDASRILEALYERARSEFPELAPPEIAPPPRPEPAPIQPVQREAPPPPPPRPPEIPSVEAPREVPLKVSVKLVLGRPDNCNECAYYGPLTSSCFLFGFSVADVSRPPCKGS